MIDWDECDFVEEDYPDVDEDCEEGDEPESCWTCRGTGEGMYDGGRCLVCKGKGY